MCPGKELMGPNFLIANFLEPWLPVIKVRFNASKGCGGGVVQWVCGGVVMWVCDMVVWCMVV